MKAIPNPFLRWLAAFAGAWAFWVLPGAIISGVAGSWQVFVIGLAAVALFLFHQFTDEVPEDERISYRDAVLLSTQSVQRFVHHVGREHIRNALAIVGLIALAVALYQPVLDIFGQPVMGIGRFAVSALQQAILWGLIVGLGVVASLSVIYVVGWLVPVIRRRRVAAIRDSIDRQGAARSEVYARRASNQHRLEEERAMIGNRVRRWMGAIEPRIVSIGRSSGIVELSNLSDCDLECHLVVRFLDEAGHQIGYGVAAEIIRREPVRLEIPMTPGLGPGFIECGYYFDTDEMHSPWGSHLNHQPIAQMTVELESVSLAEVPR